MDIMDVVVLDIFYREICLGQYQVVFARLYPQKVSIFKTSFSIFVHKLIYHTPNVSYRLGSL